MKKTITLLFGIFLTLNVFSQSGFTFTATNSSATFYGQVQINGVAATSDDWIAAFDASGNCCGASQLIVNSGSAYINLVIYGDDATTPVTDEGMSGSENFFLHLYDSSEDSILIYKSISNIVAFSGWTNTNGAPLSGYNNPATIYDFTFTPFIYGCTDPTATNYNAAANTDDGDRKSVV